MDKHLDTDHTSSYYLILLQPIIDIAWTYQVINVSQILDSFNFMTIHE